MLLLPVTSITWKKPHPEQALFLLSPFPAHFSVSENTDSVNIWREIFQGCITESPGCLNEMAESVGVHIKFLLLTASLQNKRYLSLCWYESPPRCAFWHLCIGKEAWNCLFCKFFQLFSSFYLSSRLWAC